MQIQKIVSQKCFWQLPILSCLILLFLASLGCQSVLFTALVLFKGTDTPAEFDKFKKKKVVVACRAINTLDYDGDGVPRDVAHKVDEKIRKNGKKVNLVDQKEVDRWLNKRLNRVKDFRDLGDEFDTDYVLGIELEQFQISSPSSPGNYQGRARFITKVFDMSDAGKLVYEKHSDEIIYPPNSVVDNAGSSREEFERKFLDVLAQNIGRSFYPYSPHEDYALDARAGL